MNRPLKQTLITLAIMAAIPLTCCGLPYGFFSIIAPTRWKYTFENEYPPEAVTPDETKPWRHTLRGLRVYHSMMGANDYSNNYYEYVAPRTIKISIMAELGDTDFTTRLISYSVSSSIHGKLDSHNSSSLPYKFVFDSSNKHSRMAVWHSDRQVVTDLPSGEIITAQYTIEITRDNRTTTNSYSVTMTPESRREDPFYWLPSV